MTRETKGNKSDFDIVDGTANLIAEFIKEAIRERGAASLMVSGGSSPAPVYEALSRIDLSWEKVIIGLVDERWVDNTHEASNERFVKRTLLQNHAARASFIGLKTQHKTASSGKSSVHNNIAAIPTPYDVCVMGMGLDAHTASWFPKSDGLESALDFNAPLAVEAIDAKGCQGAGSYTDRITLTLASVLSSRKIILFIPGEQKQAVFLSSNKKSIYDAPVQLLNLAANRLKIIFGDT